MATVRHLGLFPRRFSYCPQKTDQTEFARTKNRNGLSPDIWLSANYASAIYWRVKTWKFVLDARWIESSNSPQDNVIFEYQTEKEFMVGQAKLHYYQDEYLFGETPKKETKLVCGADIAEGEILIRPDDEDPYFIGESFPSHFACELQQAVESGGAGTGINASINYSYNVDFAAFYREKNGEVEFKPGIQFEATTFRWTKICASTFSGEIEPLGTYGTFSYKLLDKTFSTDIYAYNTRFFQQDFPNFLEMEVSLEAVDYWEYDPNDGLGPIYNKNTGAQLRAFPA